MEAFHYRYHPLARRMQEVVAGEIGAMRYMEATLCFPLPRFRHPLLLGPRRRGHHGRGLLCDQLVRLLGPGEPEVRARRARLLAPGVDRA